MGRTCTVTLKPQAAMVVRRLISSTRSIVTSSLPSWIASAAARETNRVARLVAARVFAESPMVTLALKASVVLLPHDRSNGYRLER